ncbi:MAG: flagellin [Paracoccaceae bacterium]
MSNISFGDRALAFQHMRHNTLQKETIQRLSEELASGKRADLAKSLLGDYTPLTRIDHATTTLQAFRTTTAEAGLFTDAMQQALGRIQQDAATSANALLHAGSTQTPELVQTASREAAAAFSTGVSALNAQIGGRSLFAGRARDMPALAPAEDMLAALDAVIAAETTVSGMIGAIDSWFDDPGGGFATMGYRGSPQLMSGFPIADSELAQITLTAESAEIRDTLKGLAMGAMISRGAFAGDLTAQAEVLHRAGEHLLGADHGLTHARAGLGIVENQIEAAAIRNDAETSALKIARSDLVGADPYRTASDLIAAQTQLEMLYTLTTRLSRMTLADYL